MATKVKAKKKPAPAPEPIAPSGLRLEWMDPATLAANPANWRRHPEAQVSALVAALDTVGWAGALLYNEQTGHLIDGHARKGIKSGEKCPVLVGSWTPEQEALILSSLDPLGAMAETDQAALDALLKTVHVVDPDLDRMLAELRTPTPPVIQEDLAPIDQAAELQKKWGTATGQLWEIPTKSGTEGKCHRLLCGDSTSAEDVARVMGGERAALMATDPPYGVDFEGAKYNPRAKEWAGIEGDKLQGDNLKDWLQGCLETWFPHMADDAAFYLWTAAMEEGAAAAAIRGSGLHIQAQIIWNKNTLILGQADYQWKHENCWYAFWKGKQHRWFGGRDKTTVWEVSKVANALYMHPMQKPVELYAIPIQNHTQSGDIVAEPFAGSGSQLLACEQLSRLCHAIEIEPKYCAVALERLSRLGLAPRLSD